MERREHGLEDGLEPISADEQHGLRRVVDSLGGAGVGSSAAAAYDRRVEVEGQLASGAYDLDDPQKIAAVVEGLAADLAEAGDLPLVGDEYGENGRG